jgi:dsDNA-binding SOS-regulon protein
VILREHIELLRSRLVLADATDEATALYIEAARDLMSEMLNQEGAPTFRVIRGGKTDRDDAPP